jgi:hypothetical protein
MAVNVSHGELRQLSQLAGGHFHEAVVKAQFHVGASPW